jgi:hypothetical protein
MDVKTLRFESEGFGGGLESTRCGDRIEIAFQGWPFLAFQASDMVARDFVIASLVEAGLKTKTVSALCHTRPARVSEVKRRLRLGGYQALIRRPSGRKRCLVGAPLRQAKTLRRQGRSIRQIGQEVGVSPSSAGRAVQGILKGREPRQDSFSGLEAPPSEREASSPDETLTSEETLVETLTEVLTEEETDETLADEETLVETLTEVLTEEELAPVEVEPPQEPEEPTQGEPPDKAEELLPGQPLPSGPAEHPCRYAGTLLICAAVQQLGLLRALTTANVRRPEDSTYEAKQAVVALLCAWASRLGSLEAMHERDARALGVVLGLERSPSVRTLHRAIAQMAASFNPITLGAELLRGLIAAVGQVPRIFGVDGHFKPYFGKEPIDKGYDTKRRMAQRGLSDVLIHDEQGRIWLGLLVGAGDKLNVHLLPSARRLRDELGLSQPLVLGFDRGGFCFETFEALNGEDFFYVGWVPQTVKLPELSSIAPADDGVGEQRLVHPSVSAEHRARLLVRRDGEALVPALTNLPESIGAAEALELLRRVRGAQENDIKAARSFAQIDRLVDRGQASHAPDDRPVDNPARVELLQRRREVRDQLGELSRIEPISRKDQSRVGGKQLVAEFEEALLTHKLSGVPAKVARVELEPEAKRAWLKTKNRSLIQPLKYLLANGRRWLLSALGPALAPSDAAWDQSAQNRTLEALIRAPGTVRFGTNEVEVTLDLPLPPRPHARLSQGLAALSGRGLRFSDGQRQVNFRLAPRPTRQELPSARLPQDRPENSK